MSIELMEKIKSLPEELQDFFCSNNRRISLEKAGFLYDLKEDDIFDISVVEDVFVGDLPLKDVPLKLMQELKLQSTIAYGVAFEINKEIFTKFPSYFSDALQLQAEWESKKANPKISEEKAWRRVLDLEPWIEEEQKEKEKEAREEVEKKKEELKQYDKLPISQALTKYPKLAEQAITMNPLKLKLFADPVRSTIKNWITDYHDFSGIGKHNAFERGNYIFHSENTKKLTPVERQKITILLRSLDEETPVYVDAQSQTLAFIEENALEQPAGKPKVTPVQNQQARPAHAPAAMSRPVGEQPMRQIQEPNPADRIKGVAPFGKTMHLSAMDHLAKLPIKQAPAAQNQASEIIQPQASQRQGVQMDKVANYFTQQSEVEQRGPFTQSSQNQDRVAQAQPQVSQQPSASQEPRTVMPSRPQQQPAQKLNFLERGGETIQKKDTQKKSDDGISFSSPQTLPSERKRVRPISPYRIAPHQDVAGREEAPLIHYSS